MCREIWPEGKTSQSVTPGLFSDILIRQIVGRFYVLITHCSVRLLLNYFIENYILSLQKYTNNIQIIFFKKIFQKLFNY